MAALEQVHGILAEMLHTQEDASTILNGTERYEFIALLLFWSEVLSSIDQIRKFLQTKETTFQMH